MYFFDKKTSYLIWNMQEGQARGVGTVKFLVVDEICRIEVVITACGKVQGTYPVYVLSGDIKSLLGEVTISQGKGNMYLKCSAGALGHQAIGYKLVTGIHIDLKTEGILEQRWLPIQQKDNQQEKADLAAQPDLQKQEQKKQDLEILEVEESPQEKKEPEEVKPPKQQNMSLYPNKWKQLCAIYPVVHPFQDGRAYLSIEPRDFVVLQERFQPMVNNSFLLHGFYHYRHLLLGRMSQGKSVQYYLGVPGVFYEKEKAAALYYGFESFEGAVTPSKEGDFGYYMKRVQI